MSVTQLGAGSNALYMVYRGAGNDQRVWGTRFSGATWGYTENIDGGDSPSAPSVDYNDHEGQLNVIARGEDNQVWMIGGWIYDWYGWYSEGGNAIDTPHIAHVSNGYMLADYLDSSYHVQTRVYDQWGNAITDWQPESTEPPGRADATARAAPVTT